MSKANLDDHRYSLLYLDLTEAASKKPNMAHKAIASGLIGSGLIQSETECIDMTDRFVRVCAKVTAQTDDETLNGARDRHRWHMATQYSKEDTKASRFYQDVLQSVNDHGKSSKESCQKRYIPRGKPELLF